MNIDKSRRLIEIAKALYSPNHSNRCFHVTFIIKKGKIQTIGINSSKTHTRNLKFNYYSNNGMDLRREVGLHSELSAIIKGGREDYSDCDFVNVRLNREGILLNAKPCRGCSSALSQTGYRSLLFSNSTGHFEEYIT